MFNRRFLRIKAFQALYSFYQDEQAGRSAHEKNLLSGLNKAYELYLFLMAFPAEFRHYVALELDNQKTKYIPQPDAIQKLETIYGNKAFIAFESNTTLNNKISKLKLTWHHNKDLFKQIITTLRQKEWFSNYADKPSKSFKEDKNFLRDLFELCVTECALFDEYMEDKYLNWEDDQVLVFNQLEKTIDGLNEEEHLDFLDNGDLEEEDLQFVKDLFRFTLDHETELTDAIAQKTKNWDPDRLAMIDLLLMKLALCEILYFNHIPIKVSINEYIEVAKLYSTPNSHGFINGVLDKIHHELKENNKLNKTGRGLVE